MRKSGSAISTAQLPIDITARYIVEERVGQGGASVVLRCLDLHTYRHTAVKLLRTNSPLAPASRARFHREARLVANLAHPHIIRMLDFGQTMVLPNDHWSTWLIDASEPIDYLCMEYIHGPTLKQLIRRVGRCPQEWMAAIGFQLIEALQTAHEMGIIHRDIKPQNIMLMDLESHAIAKLGDFGIARDLNGNSLASLTQTGQILGTPDYLAPEQVQGEPGGVQADVYALGIVFYEMLTGHLPFEAETPLAAASRRMFTDPPPLRSFNAMISRGLEEVVLWMLRRNLRERLTTMTEVAESLHWAVNRDGINPDDIWAFGPESLAVIPTPLPLPKIPGTFLETSEDMEAAILPSE